MEGRVGKGMPLIMPDLSSMGWNDSKSY